MSLPRAMLSKIHIARQELMLDDERYRSELARIAGVRSAKELTERQAEAVLKEFQRMGWMPRPSKRNAGRPHNFAAPAMPEMITKIGALLADMQLPWSYADAIAKQMFGIQRCGWVRKPGQLKGIIAALHVEQEKRAMLVSINDLLDQLGEEGARRRKALEQLPEGWDRQRPNLRRVLEELNAAVESREQS